MRKLKTLRWWFAGLFLASSFAVAAVEDPQQMVRETGDRVLAELDARKSDLEADPSKIYPLVESTVLPHFDFRAMSQSALGRFWRKATEDQKTELTLEFRELLVRTYASALLGYSDQKVEMLPVRYPPDATKVMIPTRIASPGAPPVPIDYRLRRNDTKWQVYDVVVDGVSLVTSYRGTFAQEVRKGGMDGLLKMLKDKNHDAPQTPAAT